MARRVTLLVCAALLASGCGLKTLPVPPQAHLPVKPAPIKYELVRGGVRFSWNPAPSYDTGRKDKQGRAVRRYYAGFWLLRAKVKLTEDDCPRCPVRYTKALFIRQKLTPRGRPVRPRVDWDDEDLEPGYRYVYVVRATFDARRRWLDAMRLHAPDVQLYYGQHPRPPAKVMVTGVGPGHVQVSWTPSPGLIQGGSWRGLMGYYVYRRDNKGNVLLLTPRPDTDRRVLDRQVVLGRRYSYFVKSVRLWRGQLLVGPPSAPAGLVSARRDLPSAPVDLAAHSREQGIELRWTRNPEPDVVGYLIYRREGRFEVPTGQVTGEPPIRWGSWVALTRTPEPNPFYVDTKVHSGVPYEYRLQAVDGSRPPKRSPYSTAVKIVHEPQPPR